MAQGRTVTLEAWLTDYKANGPNVQFTCWKGGLQTCQNTVWAIKYDVFTSGPAEGSN